MRSTSSLVLEWREISSTETLLVIVRHQHVNIYPLILLLPTSFLPWQAHCCSIVSVILCRRSDHSLSFKDVAKAVEYCLQLIVNVDAEPT